MQEGSIVRMIKPIDDVAKKALAAMGFKKWPTPEDGADHMIISMEEMEEPRKFDVGVQLDSYKDMADLGLWFDAKLFAELLPPELNVAEMFEQEPVLQL